MNHTGRQTATLAGGDQGSEGSVARSRPDLTLGTLLVIVAIAGGVVAQGGFHGPGRWVVGVPVAFAACTLRPERVRSGAFVVAAALLAAWIVVRGFSGGTVSATAARLGLLAAVAVVVSVCRRGGAGGRDALVTALVAAGLGVALTGWIGVAFHLDPWAVTGGSTWRAASTLTYPNAAAAVIVMTWLTHLANRHASPHRGSAALSAVLLAGALATQSRAGAVALCAGLLALAALTEVRRVVRDVIAVGIGAAVAAVGLLPGLAAGSQRSPLIAFGALLLGALIAEAVDRAWSSQGVRNRAALGAAVACVAAAPALVASAASLGDRLDLASPDRAGTNRAALDIIGSHVVAGVGPGRVVVAFPVNGGLVGTELVHNEYLQLAAELGLAGAVLALAVVIAAVRSVALARSEPVAASWAGSAAGLIAFAVHSGFDFLWHIPVVAVLAAVLFGIATASPIDLITTSTTTIREEPS